MFTHPFEHRFRDRIEETNDGVVWIGFYPGEERGDDDDPEICVEQSFQSPRDEEYEIDPGIQLATTPSARPAKLARTIGGGVNCARNDIRKPILGEPSERRLRGPSRRRHHPD